MCIGVNFGRLKTTARTSNNAAASFNPTTLRLFLQRLGMGCAHFDLPAYSRHTRRSPQGRRKKACTARRCAVIWALHQYTGGNLDIWLSLFIQVTRCSVRSCIWSTSIMARAKRTLAMHSAIAAGAFELRRAPDRPEVQDQRGRIACELLHHHISRAPPPAITLGPLPKDVGRLTPMSRYPRRTCKCCERPASDPVRRCWPLHERRAAVLAGAH